MPQQHDVLCDNIWMPNTDSIENAKYENGSDVYENVSLLKLEHNWYFMNNYAFSSVYRSQWVSSEMILIYYGTNYSIEQYQH